MGGEVSYDQPAELNTRHFHAFSEKLPSMEGKVVVVTGCTSGTGLVCAQSCAAKGATVALLNRPSTRADDAHAAVSKVATKGKVLSVPCDLTSFASVKAAAAELTRHFSGYGVDVLCNNAGVMACRDLATEDGCDIQMQTNHLSHFLLTNLLWDLLEEAGRLRRDARVVNHSSVARKGLPLRPKYLGKEGGNLGGDASLMTLGPRWVRYQQTKLANVVFTYALRDRCQAAGSSVKALVAHPGVAATHLQVNTVADGGVSAMLSRVVVSQTAEDGAMGILRCCCDLDANSGNFYGPILWAGKARLLPAEWLNAGGRARDMLWAESERTTGVPFRIAAVERVSPSASTAASVEVPAGL